MKIIAMFLQCNFDVGTDLQVCPAGNGGRQWTNLKVCPYIGCHPDRHPEFISGSQTMPGKEILKQVQNDRDGGSG